MINIRSTEMERVLRSILQERCGIRFWKVVKMNNSSGSCIFNRCSVQLGSFFNGGCRSSKLAECNAPTCSICKINMEYRNSL